MKRQRVSDGTEAFSASAKRQKLSSSAPDSSAANVVQASSHPVLSRVYPIVSSLRQYLLTKLPKTSKGTRRRIAHAGLGDDQDKELGAFLDRILIGTAAAPAEGETRRRSLELQTFTQELVRSTARSDADTSGLCWDEILQFAIWILFKRASQRFKPTHLLCHGFSRDPPYGVHGTHTAPMSTIMGLYAVQPSTTTCAMKLPVWATLLSALKGGGDKLMINLLLDCAIFEYTSNHTGALLQLSGIPITSVTPSVAPVEAAAKHGVSERQHTRSIEPSMRARPTTTKSGLLMNASGIQFLRSRILYGKPNLNSNGRVHFGLPHIHVFNRYSTTNDTKHNLHVLKYVFPHSFKLHNPFTCEVDKRETAMRLKDYTTREKEITQASLKLHPKHRDQVPKRLTLTAEMVKRIRKRHFRCSYTQLLSHFCPSRGDQKGSAETPAHHITAFATPHAEVSRFCTAVMSKLLPNECFGAGAAGVKSSNSELFCNFIDKFVKLRKAETLSLYDLCSGMSLISFTWLSPPGIDPQCKLSKSDFDTRTLLLWQFLYFVVDSILMPLIRSHFHVTESNTDRLHLFYFRHDVWKQLTEPTITRMRSGGHTERPLEHGGIFSIYTSPSAKNATESNLFRPAKFRLVPKRDSFRLITNLGHREQVSKAGKVVLGVSTNTKLWPVHQALKAECNLDKTRLGSAMFNKGEVGRRLHDFQRSLLQQGWQTGAKLYFAKVDIQSCFDSIPQDKALQLLQEEILAAGAYDIQKYADVSPPSHFQYNNASTSGTLRPRYASHSTRSQQQGLTPLIAADKPLAPLAVRTPTGTIVTESQTRLHALLRRHITQHTIRIGKKEYRQAQGVPQGSVISTLLCNFFYAKYEEQHLEFLRRPDTTMMRLIDDFLVISMDKDVVRRFVKQMHAGNPDFGLTVQASKTVVSWETGLDTFPFCGLEIDTRTLEVLKQAGSKGTDQTFDTLTVEHSRAPGRVFHRKMLNGLKIQLQPVLLENGINSPSTALTNLYTLLHSSAARSYAYTRSTRIADQVLIQTVASLAAISASTLRSYAASHRQHYDRHGSEQHKSSRGTERRMSAHAYHQRQKHCLWLACRAYHDVFRRRQTGHAPLLAWLVGTMETTCAGGSSLRAFLEEVVRRFERAVAAAAAAA